MSDIVFGSLIIRGEYEGNLKEIAKVLNGFVFESDDGQDERFVVRNGLIVSSRSGVNAVCGEAYPWLRLSDTERAIQQRVIYQIQKLTWRKVYETIPPLLTCGTLELVVVMEYKTKEIALGHFEICPNGWVVQHSGYWHNRSRAPYEAGKLAVNEFLSCDERKYICGSNI